MTDSRLNYTNELALLMQFTGQVATAIRMYSAYSGGSPSDYLRISHDRERDSIDLMFLSDSLHHFSELGFAVQKGEAARIVDVCDSLLRNFSDYQIERPEFGTRQAKPTFERWKNTIDLDIAKGAVDSIRCKAVVK